MHYWKIFFVLLFFFLCVIPSPSLAQTNDPKQRYVKATVEKIVKEEEKKEPGGYTNFTQTLTVRITEGVEKNKEVTVEYGGMIRVTPNQKLHSGDSVILLITHHSSGKTIYSIMDRYRLGNVLIILFTFLLMVIGISGKKGLGAIVGMIASLCIILFFIVPNILSGEDPVLISILGSIGILFSTLYLAHGFSKKTHVALLATSLTLILAGIFSSLFVQHTFLSGLGNENTYLLQFGQQHINLSGILLGGMIIGALGVLDDITTAQSATIFELAKTSNHTLSFEELFSKGMSIGREHIASLVNTLVLAYAGASLGIFLLFVLNPAKQPYWVILNSEVIIEEVIRTISGSSALILAVPITTLLASFFATRKIRFQ